MIQIKENQTFKTNLLKIFGINETAKTLILVLVAGMLITTFYIRFNFQTPYSFRTEYMYKRLHDYCLWKHPFHTQQEFLDKFHFI